MLRYKYLTEDSNIQYMTIVLTFKMVSSLHTRGQIFVNVISYIFMPNVYELIVYDKKGTYLLSIANCFCFTLTLTLNRNPIPNPNPKIVA